LIHPTSAVCATTDTARGEERLPSEQNQAILKSSGMPLGECRLKAPMAIRGTLVLLARLTCLQIQSSFGLLHNWRQRVLNAPDLIGFAANQNNVATFRYMKRSWSGTSTIEHLRIIRVEMSGEIGFYHRLPKKNTRASHSKLNLSIGSLRMKSHGGYQIGLQERTTFSAGGTSQQRSLKEPWCRA